MLAAKLDEMTQRLDAVLSAKVAAATASPDEEFVFFIAFSGIMNHHII